MSAISVVWSRESAQPVSLLQQRMLAAQTMYGRTECRSWEDDRISLGCNLSLSLPEDRFDRQPLWAPDRSCCLVGDVRIDNRGDLARDLNLVHPEEIADAEILLSAWLRWGASCLDRVIGGFAFAVWIPSTQQLFAARDHAGERPLFYYRGRDVIAIASMPKALLTLPLSGRSFRESHIGNWLAGIQPDRSASFFEEITRLPPGYFVRITPYAFECRQYWHPAQAKPTRYRRDRDYAEALVEVLDRATAARLRSTSPIGSQLSAGLDSSSVVASAAHLLASEGRTLTAFTSVPRPEFNNIAEPWFVPNEGAGAAELCAMYPNIEHVLVDSGTYKLLPTMRQWSYAMDEPALNVVNLLWLRAIFERARDRGIQVMLEGTCGNETISWESSNLLGRLFRRGRWLKLARTAFSLRAHGDISLRTALRSSTAGLLPGWLDRRLLFAQDLSPYSSLANPELRRRYDLENRTLAYSHFRTSDPLVDRNLLFERFDAGTFHAAVQGLTGIELRDPTGDKRVFEFCFSIPLEQFIAGGHSRSLVRRAMRGRIPDSIRLRYSRGHQGADWYIPVSESLAELRDELQSIRESPAASQAVDLDAMEELLDSFPDSGYHTRSTTLRWHISLTRAFSLASFLRNREIASATATRRQSTAVPLG